MDRCDESRLMFRFTSFCKTVVVFIKLFFSSSDTGMRRFLGCGDGVGVGELLLHCLVGVEGGGRGREGERICGEAGSRSDAYFSTLV